MSLDKALAALGRSLEGVAEEVAGGIQVRRQQINDLHDEIGLLQRSGGLLYAMEPLLSELGRTLAPLDSTTPAEIRAEEGTTREIEPAPEPERPASLDLDPGGTDRATGHVPTAAEAIAEAGDRLTPQQRADLDQQCNTAAIEEIADQVDVDGRVVRDAAAADEAPEPPSQVAAPSSPAPSSGGTPAQRRQRTREAVQEALTRLPAGWQTTKQIASEAGVDGGTASKMLKSVLLVEGIVEHNGKGGAGGRYRLNASSSPPPRDPASALEPDGKREGRSKLAGDARRVLAGIPGTTRAREHRVKVLEVLSEHGEMFTNELGLRAAINMSQARETSVVLQEHGLVVCREVKPTTGGAAKLAWRLPTHPVNPRLDQQPHGGWGISQDRQQAGKPPQTLNGRVIHVVVSSMPEGLTTDQMAQAVIELGATEPREMILEEIRKKWRAGVITLRNDGTFATTLKTRKAAAADADDAEEMAA